VLRKDCVQGGRLYESITRPYHPALAGSVCSRRG
jgi:hypothetical protein